MPFTYLSAYEKEFETILMVLLGWLLALFATSINERIRRDHRRRDLVRAVVDEMLGLQHVMAIVSYQIRRRNAQVSDELLDRLIRVVEAYDGPDKLQNVLRAMKERRKLPEAQRVASDQSQRNPDVGLGLKQYPIPLFTSQVSDLAVCDTHFQRQILHIRYHLDLYNQDVASAREWTEKTFNNPKSEDRKALITNTEEIYDDACIRAEVIVNAVTALRQKYGGKSRDEGSALAA